MSYYQISSGNGPVECELAVGKFLEWLKKSFTDVEVIETRQGHLPYSLKSAWIKSDMDLARYCGSIRWICQSPCRPGHKRKNWYINFMSYEDREGSGFDEKQVVYQTMRAGGHGGQNVNKVESAVRATYLPDGFSTVCQDERSQHMNKKRALDRIRIHFLEKEREAAAGDKKDKWTQHNNLQRGQESASFSGENFLPVLS